MKLLKKHTLIVILILSILYAKRDLIKFQIINYIVKKKVATLLTKRQSYVSGILWPLQSVDFGTTNPPYYLDHIYSESGGEFKLVRFEVDSCLNIINESEINYIQFEKDQFDTISPNYKVGITKYLMTIAMEKFDEEEYFPALIMVQEIIKMDSMNIEAKELKSIILSKIN